MTKTQTLTINTYADAKALAAKCEAEMKIANKALTSIPGVGTGPMGLTPDEVKFSPRYRAALAERNRCNKNLRAINGLIMKRFKKEYKADSKIYGTNK